MIRPRRSDCSGVTPISCHLINVSLVMPEGRHEPEDRHEEPVEDRSAPMSVTKLPRFSCAVRAAASRGSASGLWTRP
jgi:hypothetical protein